MKEYMKTKRASESFQPSPQSPQSKENKKHYLNEYMGEKRASEALLLLKTLLA
jgi:hypothetical protein